MFMASVATEDYVDDQVRHLSICWCPRVMLIWLACMATWSHGDIWVQALPQPGSGLNSIAPDITEGCANTQDLGHHLRPGWDVRVMS